MTYKFWSWFFPAVAAFTFCAHAYIDESHTSTQFGETRKYRVFTPPDYDSANTVKKYPIIFYFHGCGGNWQRDGFMNYQAGNIIYDLNIPGRPYLKGLIEDAWGTDQTAHKIPYNADFEIYSDTVDVIIIQVDGHIYQTSSGCGDYYPYDWADTWTDNDFNFSLYIRELIADVDSKYNTIGNPSGRAISGLSRGGHAALWIAAANPHYISSASQWSFSPGFKPIGVPPYKTFVNPIELWRNFRGISYQSTTNLKDRLRGFTQQLSGYFTGAGFENKYHLTDFQRHWAADIDVQYDFHMSHMNDSVGRPPTFSFCFGNDLD